MTKEELYNYLSRNLELSFTYSDGVPVINLHLEGEIISDIEIPIDDIIRYIGDAVFYYNR